MHLPLLTLCLLPALQEPEAPGPVLSDLAAAARVLRLELEPAELEQMLPAVRRHAEELERLRAHPLAPGEPFGLGFDPLLPGREPRLKAFEPTPLAPAAVEGPLTGADLAYADIPTLAGLLRSGHLSCVELTGFHLERLERLDARLNAVVTLTRARALEQARALDAELADGHDRGLLHGIPYGAKDLLAVAGYPTTWGAAPYREQVLSEDASVIRRLDEAGAVLVAKLSLGALAMGDEWFRGRTNNPWNPEQGSSGSSAGSAAASAAGLVPFAIGSETLGSIVSPSVRCGNTSLRPTFGRVARGGAMPLSWTMDKLGVLARSATDCAIVLDAIHGEDGVDLDAVSRPFTLSGPVEVEGWRVGVLAEELERSPRVAHTAEALRGLGVEVVTVDLPRYPVWEMMLILMAEAACAFDELTRDGRDDELVQQGDDAWPNLFRAARLLPAVEYVRASRLRHALARDLDRAVAGVDLLVHEPRDELLGITNLTGHPCVVAPCGEAEAGRQPPTIAFTGQLHDEAALLALVQRWQAATAWESQRPPGFGD
jgi:Asp-tRNA(Asn)/Glu-tRNA(Gln) amidotransferase A subunit family amidase